jgi:hypothetical protein
MLIDLPQHVAEKSAGLGEPLAHFETSWVQLLLCLILSVPIILLGVGGIVLGIVLLNRRNALGFPGKLFWLCGLLILTGFGLLGRWRTLRGTGVFAFAGGFVRYDRANADAVRWASVRQILRGAAPGQKQQLTMATPARLALTDDAGREWVFTETLSGLKEFREAAEDRTLPHLLPDLLDQILDGQTVPFGDIAVTERGLGHPQQPFLPWDQVAGAGVEKEKVVIRSALTKKPYCRVDMFNVPNPHLLLAIIEQFRLHPDETRRSYFFPFPVISSASSPAS